MVRYPMNTRVKIQSRLDVLEELMRVNDIEGMQQLLPSISKFYSVLSEEEREYLQAARLRVSEGLSLSQQSGFKILPKLDF